MRGINFVSTAKAKKAVKLASEIASYLFEEECGELRYANDSNIKALRAAQKALGIIAQKSSK